ncbi:MAG TPA: AraC family transcriptional regulator [Paucimonas sp.]|nr:AraC family transcriptional regulator [Paucimonas sp.]
MTEIVTGNSRWNEVRPGGAFAPQVSDHRIRRALEWMAADIVRAGDSGLERIAKEVGLSRAHFFELFRQNTSLTPALFRNMLRMEEAYRQVAEGRNSLGAIADEMGFRAQSQFTRFFAMNHGVTPSIYRRAALRI